MRCTNKNVVLANHCQREWFVRLYKWLLPATSNVQAKRKFLNDEQDTKMALMVIMKLWLNGLQKMQIFAYGYVNTLKEGKLTSLKT